MLKYIGLIASGICMTHLNFSTEDINFYESNLFWVSIFSFFWVGGILNQFLIQKNENTNQEMGDFFFTLIALSLISIAAIAAINSFVNLQIQCSFVFSYLILQSSTYIIEHHLYKKNHHKLLFIYGLTSLILPSLAVAFNSSIESIFTFLILIVLLKFISVIVFLIKNNYNFVRISILNLNILKRSLPLTITILVSGSGEYIDGIIIKNYFNDQFAIYRYGARELPILFVLANALSTSSLSNLTNNLENGLKDLKHKSTFLMHLSFPLAIVLIFISKVLFTTFFTQKFESSAMIFNTYLLLIIPRLLFPQTILNAAKNSHWTMRSAFIEIVINIILSILLMQYFGLIGIALGTVIAYSFDKLFLCYITQKKLKISIHDFTNVKWWTMYSLALIIAYLINWKFYA